MLRRRRSPGMRWQDLLRFLDRRPGKRPPPKDGDHGGVPVEPDKPKGLSGGAAAELEYDD